MNERRTPIALSEVVKALAAGEIRLSARVTGSVSRFYGDAYSVELEVECGGFAFVVEDEIGLSVLDFGLRMQNVTRHDALFATREDQAALSNLRIKDPFSGRSEDRLALDSFNCKLVASAVMTASCSAIRHILDQSFPKTARRHFA